MCDHLRLPSTYFCQSPVFRCCCFFHFKHFIYLNLFLTLKMPNTRAQEFGSLGTQEEAHSALAAQLA